jgi:hypothetical protein
LATLALGRTAYGKAKALPSGWPEIYEEIQRKYLSPMLERWLFEMLAGKFFRVALDKSTASRQHHSNAR